EARRADLVPLDERVDPVLRHLLGGLDLRVLPGREPRHADASDLGLDAHRLTGRPLSEQERRAGLLGLRAYGEAGRVRRRDLAAGTLRDQRVPHLALDLRLRLVLVLAQ